MWCKINNTTFNSLIFLVKIWSEKEFLYLYSLELSAFEYDNLVGLHIKEAKNRGNEGEGADEQALSNKPPLIQCGEAWVSDSRNLSLSFLGAQEKICVKRMKEKFITFIFIKFNAKVSPKSLRKGRIFCAEARSLFS